jgi:PAS domain S-box-containing protein
MSNESNLMQTFIDSCDAVIYLKDEQGRYLMVNRAFEEVFKVSREQILGKTDYDITSKEQADKWRSLDNKVRQTGTPINHEATVSLPGGAITGIEGSPNAVGGIAIKITDTK